MIHAMHKLIQQALFDRRMVGLTLFGGLIVAMLPAQVPAAVAGPAMLATGQEETVSLAVKFGDAREEMLVEDIPWRETMTVFDVMRAAKQKNSDFTFKHRGTGETLFVLEIADQANEGAGGKNWTFLVDDKLGQRSCGVVTVKAGQRVTWRFGKYRPND